MLGRGGEVSLAAEEGEGRSASKQCSEVASERCTGSESRGDAGDGRGEVVSEVVLGSARSEAGEA
jgi:hypothetical protein